MRSSQGRPSPSPEAGSEAGSDRFLTQAPTLSLPKGGGAIRGIGEKFSANPVTGTGSMAIPIAVSPGRGGFGPQLTLSYDSGAGNGPFGLGWDIALPQITRKTDKGLPRYLDDEESDTFMLAGAEDLVRVGTGDGTPLADEMPTVYGVAYRIRTYRPRTEGLFARIERWTPLDGSPAFWRTISRDNTTTWFGRTPESRVHDPADATRVFRWLICETHDDKGNVAVYRYQKDDARNIDTSRIEESNRPSAVRQTQTYLKSIRYGNRHPYQPSLTPAPGPWQAPDNDPDAWMFEVVFDYGDHPGDTPAHEASAPWAARPDAFSSHRAGFEIRTQRLCRRVLMFHHFPAHTAADGSAVPAEPGLDRHTLVRATAFGYTKPDPTDDPAQPGFVRLNSVTPWSYQRHPDTGTMERRSLPPLGFRYSEPVVVERVHTLSREALPNLPIGTQGMGLHWIDLDGEGLNGVLTVQGHALRFAPNRGDGRFGPLRVVSPTPAMAAESDGQHQWMDIDGDGRIELVDFGGPTPGFHRRDDTAGWKQHIPFASLPQVDWQDPNLRFVDLTGDGHADALITEHDVFTWYPSREAQGFGASQRHHLPADDKDGPRLVFADGEQSVFLADMCGDGLTDLVRIRNGDVCYWPNLGYGRFGRKVTLGNAPRFDTPERFDPRRIRLADIDGSGPVDLIYLDAEGAQLYFNRSGNRLSHLRRVPLPVATENLNAVQVADLMGNGTACLVWNSHLPADAEHPVRYIELMGGQKPHLLLAVDNHLGALTTIEYTPSTRFYLDDLAAGEPWVTRLPFPVHCVSRVTVSDRHRGTTFSSSTSYHHGYFDGVEREFRGFGRVEQVDTEHHGLFAENHLGNPYVTQDHQLHQPPVKTVTWYHTGAALDRQRILTQFEREYFPARFADRLAASAHPFAERRLPEPELPPDLSASEWTEALRACKGMVLRQETYELDLDALTGERPRHVPVRLYGVATHNGQIRRLQARGPNRHAVFQVVDSEAITYHHELDLRGSGALTPDPRVAHTLTLRHDELGNALQTVTVAYRRRATGAMSGHPHQALIDQVQQELHVAYAETRYTGDVRLPLQWTAQQQALRHHRLRLPCEVRSYDITGLAPPPDACFDIAALRRVQLCEDPSLYPADGPAGAQTTLATLAYHQSPAAPTPHRRLVEQVRTLFFDDGGDQQAPSQALPFGQLGPRGLKYEDYKLALTDGLLGAVFGVASATDPLADKLAWPIQGSDTPRSRLNDPARSGYIAGSVLDARFTGQYWVRSGIAGFAADAHAHFFLPERYTDPFGNVTTLSYDTRDLYVRSSQDAKGNRSDIVRFDHRVLAPAEMVDANGNHSELAFDIRGLPVASALKGKPNPSSLGGWEADDLGDFDFERCNPPDADVLAFCTSDTLDTAQARQWLGRATARFVYQFGGLESAWLQHLPGACTLARERHQSAVDRDTEPDIGKKHPLQVSLECSDGSGQVLMKKVQAEPAPGQTGQRWIVNGLTQVNNKGKPVRQYEPVFSDRFGFERPQANGVSTTLFYDAAGRVIRTDMPDGSFSRVEFSPWFSRSFDANDTVLDSRWYREKGRNAFPPDRPLPSPPFVGRAEPTSDERAGWLAAQHANTPSETHFDSLGRDVIAIAHNRTPDDQGVWQDEHHLSFTKLDAEGKPLWIRDALGHLVMQYIQPPRANNASGEAMPHGAAPCYDIAGHLLFQHSMDAGDRWSLSDAAGKPMCAWDIHRAVDTPNAVAQRRLYTTDYDALHRPTAQWIRFDDEAPRLVEAFDHCDTLAPRDSAGPLSLKDARERNLIGQVVNHWDPSGRATVERIDLSGQPAHITRRLVRVNPAHDNAPALDWTIADREELLEDADSETFHQLTEHDALGRMTRLYNWHRSDDRVAVYEPRYNPRGLLQSEWLHVRARKTTDPVTGAVGFVSDPARRQQAIQDIRYNAKGQKEWIRLGNGTETTCSYDPDTFRLTSLRTVRQVTPRGVQDLVYTHDPVGNITRIVDTAQETVFHDNARIEPQQDYLYDALYRLIEATGRENGAAMATPPSGGEGPWPRGSFPTDDTLANYTQQYRYDAVGNFRTMTHRRGNTTAWTRQYAYAFDDPTQPASNRLWRTWSGDGPWKPASTDSVTYHHDSHGSMLNLNRVETPPPQAEDWGHQIDWDWRDMIQRFDAIGGGWARYHYGIDKQRTRKHITRIGGEVQDRLYLGGYELYRRTSAGGETIEEIESHHLFEGEQRVLLVDDVLQARQSAQPGPNGLTVDEQTLFRYQYGNHLGSVALELDGSMQARVISYEEFHPYGTSAYRLLNAAFKAPAKRYRYTGMERDEESGLSYHSARYYMPWAGRWCNCDPIDLGDGTNIYLYTQANPTRNTDATGTKTDEARFEEDYFVELQTKTLRNGNELASLINERNRLKAELKRSKDPEAFKENQSTPLDPETLTTRLAKLESSIAIKKSEISKNLETLHQEVSKFRDERIEDKTDHDRLVTITINLEIIEAQYQNIKNDLGQNKQEVLESARASLLKHFRNNKEISNSSINTVYRDAEYYLVGRFETLSMGGNNSAQKAATTTAGVAANTLYGIGKSLPGVDAKTDKEFPNAPAGGSGWIIEGGGDAQLENGTDFGMPALRKIPKSQLRKPGMKPVMIDLLTPYQGNFFLPNYK